jgi:hypothetical protein
MLRSHKTEVERQQQLRGPVNQPCSFSNRAEGAAKRTLQLRRFEMTELAY